MEKTRECDVLISGGGAAGLALGHMCASFGLKVIVAEIGAALACGASSKNEGWCHSGAFHMAAIVDKLSATSVTRRTQYGYRSIMSFVPEAVEDPGAATFVVVERASVEHACRRWTDAGIPFRKVNYPAIDEDVLAADVVATSDVFATDDWAINTRIFYAKLARGIGEIHLNSQIVDFDGSRQCARIRNHQTGEQFTVRAQLFVYAMGPGLGTFVRRYFDTELGIQLRVSHLLECPKRSRHNYFQVSVGERDATVMNHGSWSVFGLTREQRVVDDPQSYRVSDETRNEVLAICTGLIPRLAECQESDIKVRHCIKVTTRLDEDNLPDLNPQWGEIMPGHVWVLAGKMTEAPFVASRIFQDHVWGQLELGKNVAMRPIDDYEC